MVKFMLSIVTTVKKKKKEYFQMIMSVSGNYWHPLIYGLYFTTFQVFVNC